MTLDQEWRFLRHRRLSSSFFLHYLNTIALDQPIAPSPSYSITPGAIPTRFDTSCAYLKERSLRLTGSCRAMGESLAHRTR